MVTAAITAVTPRATRGRPISTILTDVRKHMQTMVEKGRAASIISDPGRRALLLAEACEYQREADSLVRELRGMLRFVRAIIVDRYPRHGEPLRIEMSSFPSITAGRADASCYSASSWGEIEVKGVNIPLCHVRSIQVIR